MADKNAKEATVLPEVSLNIRYSKTELKSLVKTKLKGKWQTVWDSAITGRGFYNIQRYVGNARSTYRTTQEEDIVSRMRFGHTGLNSTLF